jgi:hypothetical protein
MQVTVFHNGQRECRDCCQPVTSIGDDKWAHLQAGADHEPQEVSSPGYFGYQAGHALVPVFKAEVPDGMDPFLVAELMFEAGNADPGMLGSDRHGIDLAALAVAYRFRRLSSLSVGDVVAAGGEVALHCARVGWELVEGDIKVTWAGDFGTVPLPHCSYCGSTGDDTTLEPFNLSGNLACRDGAGCSARVNAGSRP